MCTTELTPHDVAVWASSESLRRFADGKVPADQIQDTALELAADWEGDPVFNTGEKRGPPSASRSTEPPAPSSRTARTEPAHNAHRILVVDDEPTIAEFIAHVLTDEGHEVRCASDGQMALAEIDQRWPDLIVSDIKMPHLSGLDLLERLQAREDAMPVVLMSAVYNDVDIPGVHFVPKPFDIDHLSTVVDRALREATA